jgi:N-acetylneuraminic acid mutarotase
VLRRAATVTRRWRRLWWSSVAVITLLAATWSLLVVNLEPGAKRDPTLPEPGTPGGLRTQPNHAAGSGSKPQGRWRLLPEAPDARNQSYSNLASVRIGHQVIVVAGASSRGKRVRGLAFDLRTRRWSRLARSPLAQRGGQTVVGGARGAIVWGGASDTGLEGARYDLGTGRWTRLARSPLGRRGQHTAVWTGRRMLIWGGAADRRALADGAAYDPRSDRWEKIGPAPIHGRLYHTAVWTGRRMLVWGGDVSGRSTGEDGRYASDGASYDPASNRWTTIAPSPVRSDGTARAVWTGRAMIVWTGAEGAEYDPATDRWRRIPLAPLLRHTGHTAVWSGGEMVVWGDYCCGRRVRFGGAAYDPSPGVWRSLPRSPLGSRDRHAAVGTPGGGMFVWGGCCRRGYLADGALYER